MRTSRTVQVKEMRELKDVNEQLKSQIERLSDHNMQLSKEKEKLLQVTSRKSWFALPELTRGLEATSSTVQPIHRTMLIGLCYRTWEIFKKIRELVSK